MTQDHEEGDIRFLANKLQTLFNDDKNQDREVTAALIVVTDLIKQFFLDVHRVAVAAETIARESERRR